MGGGERAGQGEEVGGRVIGQRRKGPLAHEGRKAGALLNGQLVEAEVVCAQSQRAGQFGVPLAGGLAGAGVDEVDVGAGEMGLGESQRRQRLAHPMQPAQKAERGIIQGLYAERYTVDAGGCNPCEFGRLDRGWVGFQRDLDVGGKAPQALGLGQEGCDEGGGHQRGCAAAKEDAGERGAAGQFGLMGHVGEEGAGP